MTVDPEELPSWVTWQRRPFPRRRRCGHRRRGWCCGHDPPQHGSVSRLRVSATLIDYDVGWVNLALDGPDATATALASLHRLVDLAPRVLLPAHGPIPADPGAALATAVRRAQRLVDDPAGAVWYEARRILAFALMIHGGIAVRDQHLHATADHTPVAANTLQVPFPRAWPAGGDDQLAFSLT